MSRDYKVYLDDIVAAINKIAMYTDGVTEEQFFNDTKTYDAVVRNLEIIGEAAKKIPDDVRKKYPRIEWRKAAGLRDLLIHEYFAVDTDIIGMSSRTSCPSSAGSWWALPAIRRSACGRTATI